jgi:hypothetical protein
MNIAVCLEYTLKVEAAINTTAYFLFSFRVYRCRKYNAVIINANVGISVIIILENRMTNGVVISNNDENSAVLSS